MTKQRSNRLSIIPARAVFDERLRRTDLALLCALAAYANRKGRCWPATTTLASDLQISTSMFRRCRRNLETCGYIKTKHQAGQRSVYSIIREATDPGHIGSGVEPDPGHIGSGGADIGVPGTPDTQVPPKDTKKRHTERKDILDDHAFDEFWKTYPSRQPHSNPQKPARDKFEAALKRGVPASDIIRGAENYAIHVRRDVPDRKYVAQAKTWLEQERWAEYQKVPVRPDSGHKMRAVI